MDDIERLTDAVKNAKTWEGVLVGRRRDGGVVIRQDNGSLVTLYLGGADRLRLPLIEEDTGS